MSQKQFYEWEYVAKRNVYLNQPFSSKHSDTTINSVVISDILKSGKL